MAAARKGRFTVRTAYEGDVFEASPELRVDSEGVWAGDKLQDLTESNAFELAEHARQHSVAVTVQSLDQEPDAVPTDGKE